MKTLIAARVAARLERETGRKVHLVHGGLGELSVRVDDQVLYDGNRLGYALPGRIVKTVRTKLAADARGSQ